MTFSGRFIANIIQVAQQQGADTQVLFAIVNKSIEELCDERCRIEMEVYNKVVETTIQLTKDDLFGLHLGEGLSLSVAGLIAQITQTCSTIKEAMDYMVLFANLGCQALPFKLEQKDRQWALSTLPYQPWVTNSPLAFRHTLDGTMVFTLREFHTLTHQKHYPLAVHFSYKRPNDIEQYERVFKCPILFNQTQNAMYFDAKHLELPIITSDYNLLRILVRYANEKLAMIEQQSGFTSIVRRSILHLVKPQFPTIQQVADNLNISVRTLQRRLKEEEQTYKMVLDNLRQQFAIDYLKNDHLNIQEIAYLLDYSEASTFIRSFKR